MTYIKTQARHPMGDSPGSIIFEIDKEDRNEVRPAAHSPDGRVECALEEIECHSEETVTRDTQLSVPAVPFLDERRAHGSSEWAARSITKNEFKAVWTDVFARQTG